MSIVAVPDELPGLIRRPGMTSWKVLDNNLEPAPHPDAPAPADAPEPPSAEDVVPVEQDNDKQREGQHKGKGKANSKPHVKGARKTWSKTLWPAGDEKERGLEHCLRLYPHLQDTGAFFVCVLEKKADAAPAPVADDAAMKDEAKEAPSTAEKRERASSPSRPEGEPEAKKVKQDEPVPELQVESPAPAATAEKAEGKKEHVMGAGRPFNEEPYIYLPGLEDDQVKLIKYAPLGS